MNFQNNNNNDSNNDIKKNTDVVLLSITYIYIGLLYSCYYYYYYSRLSRLGLLPLGLCCCIREGPLFGYSG